MENELRDLSKRERFLRKTFDAVRMFVDDYDPDTQSNQVSVRLARLDETFVNLLDVRRKIDLLTDNISEAEDSTEQPKERAVHLKIAAEKRQDANEQIILDVENDYCSLRANLLSLQPSSVSGTESANATDAPAGLSRVKLPEIRLPSFSGQIKDWISFRDTFRSLIHENSRLSAMDKFNYLRLSVTGEALQEISSVQLSAANYEVAWNALVKRYENCKLIVKAHLDSLFAIEVLKRESYDSLSHLISEFDKHLSMLAKVGEDTSHWSTILAHMVCSRLDAKTLRHWESHHNSKQVARYDDLMDFLRNHCFVLQSIVPIAKSAPPTEKHIRFGVNHSTLQSVQPSPKCPFCSEQPHSAFRCNKFLKMSVSERYDVIRLNRLCLNCLSPGHQARSCDRGSCHHCHQRHHSLLHTNSSVIQAQGRPSTSYRQQPQSQSQSNRQPTQLPSHNRYPPTNTARTTTNTQTTTSHSQTTTSPSTSTSTCPTQAATSLPTNIKSQSSQVLLSTAIVHVMDRYGNMQPARALLDSCSQFCFMTTNICQKLKLRGSPERLTVQGIGGSSVISKKVVDAMVQPRLQQISSFNSTMSFYVLPEVTAVLPVQRIETERWNLPTDCILADPHFCEPGKVDIIIGAEYYFDLLIDGRTKITNAGPTLQNTVFGWIVSGRIPAEIPAVPHTSCSYSVVDIHELMTKFWELETCRSTSTQSVEESACETIFDKTTVRDETGRFIVTLPKREFIIKQLGDTKHIAMRCFTYLEKRFQANPELKAAYSKFIKEYQLLNHMKEIPVDQTESSETYYMPHHAVMKLESTTTQLRVVFNASCKSSTGVSLNDALMTGPTVQDDLMSPAVRFRFHQIAFVADVEKMYRMVNVTPKDRKLQRILWRESPEEPIRTYELSTVTYGTASAPYLATKCLQRLADISKQEYPQAAQVLRSDFYVDDMLTGTNTVDEAKHLAEDMIKLMKSGGFNLRKWNSNNRELLSELPADLLDDRTILELDSSSSPVKTLGLLWEPGSDNFMFRCPAWTDRGTLTKRIVSSEAARLFDPYGLVGPVIVLAKMFLQVLWQAKLEWDDPLPEPLKNFWEEYRRNLAALDSLSVPRWLGYKGDLAAVEIHGFCDASEKAYGACLYLRCISSDNSVEVNLIMAKSRVAPLEDLKRKKKKQTIPRLELSSGLLLSHIYEKFKNCVRIEHAATFYTDSEIVLCWLSSLPSRWQTFIANRCSEIQHITKDCSWKHVAGTENPADIISRGMIPAQLNYSTLWFKGPAWLACDKSTWPADQRREISDPSLLEEKIVAVPATVNLPFDVFTLRSSLIDLVRMVAWWRRLAHRLWNPNATVRTGYLIHTEHEEALLALIRLAQKESFAEEIRLLQKGRELQPSSRILQLNPILIDGVMRVGGRLSNAPVSAARKHPIILCHRHPLSKLIIVQYHHKLYHAGLQTLVASLREKFWITRVRQLANQVIHQCVPCFRNKPKISEQLMADLPSERVTPAPAFIRVGVDYCGPFLIKYPGRRGTPTKCFVAVFVCLVTKAVHLELVADLTTEGFLAAFNRFISRRGKPAVVMCDNATNFIGAKRQLDELHQLFISQQFQQSVVREAAADNIKFDFIPPRSPNFGGLWEAAVKSFKTHFKRTIGLHVLQYDEMQTVITQIEAVLNSRPLTPISNDPNDYEALTPGHFLIQRPLTAYPEPDLGDVPENRLSRWQRVQDFVQRIWKKWSTQYLSDLLNRTKWTRTRDNISIGTMVLVKDDNLPPLKWRLGRVVAVYKGSDDNIRVVTVRTQYGQFDRCISKICVLPIRDNQPVEEDHQLPRNLH